MIEYKSNGLIYKKCCGKYFEAPKLVFYFSDDLIHHAYYVCSDDAVDQFISLREGRFNGVYSHYENRFSDTKPVCINLSTIKYVELRDNRKLECHCLVDKQHD